MDKQASELMKAARKMGTSSAKKRVPVPFKDVKIGETFVDTDGDVLLRIGWRYDGEGSDKLRDIHVIGLGPTSGWTPNCICLRPKDPESHHVGEAMQSKPNEYVEVERD